MPASPDANKTKKADKIDKLSLNLLHTLMQNPLL